MNAETVDAQRRVLVFSKAAATHSVVSQAIDIGGPCCLWIAAWDKAEAEVFIDDYIDDYDSDLC